MASGYSEQDIYISASHSWPDLRLKELWQYRELVFLFAKRRFRAGYRQTILGPLWLFLNPLLSSVFYVILFGNIAKLSTGGVPQLLFYMSGHALWTFFSDRISSGAKTFSSNAGLVGKVYFPRLAVPFADILSGVMRLAIQLLLILGLYLYYFCRGQVRPYPLMLLTLPLIIAELGLMGMGFGIIISSLTTKYRDLLILVSFGLQLFMYATPVVYPVSSVSGRMRHVLLCNPVTAPMELFRLALFRTGSINPAGLLYSFAFTLAIVFIGIAIFNRMERSFMDTV